MNSHSSKGAPSSSSSIRKLSRVLTVFLLVAAAFYCYQSIHSDWDQVIQLIRLQSIVTLVTTLAIASFGLSLGGVGLCFIYRSLCDNADFSWTRLTGTYLVANIFRYVPGKVATAVYLVQASGVAKVPLSQSAIIMISTSLMTGACCGLCIGYVLSDSTVKPALLLLAILGGLIILTPYFLRFGSKLLRKRFGKEFSLKPNSIVYRDLGIGVSNILFSWLIVGLSFASIVATSIELDSTTLIVCILLYPASFSAGFLVVTAPAGIGVREAVIVTVLMQCIDWPGGPESSQAMSISLALLHRFLMTASDLLLCGIGFFLRRLK
jgi:glycosyltransferase 2 family protein